MDVYKMSVDIEQAARSYYAEGYQLDFDHEDVDGCGEDSILISLVRESDGDVIPLYQVDPDGSIHAP